MSAVHVTLTLLKASANPSMAARCMVLATVMRTVRARRLVLRILLVMRGYASTSVRVREVA